MTYQYSLRDLDPAVRAEHDRELDVVREEWLTERASVDGCALVAGWCLTHQADDTMAHHFAANPGAYND